MRALVACLNEAAANRKKAEGAIIPDSDPLIEGLRRKLAAEPHLSLCSNIVEALANIGDAPAIGVLVESLKNPSPELRRFAAHSLLRAGYTTTNDGERICLLIASEDWRGLLAMGKRSVAPLFSFYTQEHDYMALQTLAKFGPRAIDEIVAGVTNVDRQVRLDAIEVLSYMKDTNTLGLLIACLKDPDGDVRQAAASALGRIGDTAAVGPLADSLTDNTWKQAWRALEALGRLGDPRALPAIAPFLVSSNGAMRNEAWSALEKISGPEAMHLAIGLVNDSNESVRHEALEALNTLANEDAVGPLIEGIKKYPMDCGRYAAVLQKLGRSPLHELVELLKDAPPSAGPQAIRALERLGQPAIEPLTRFLEHPAKEVREQVARALSSLGGIPSSADRRAQYFLALNADWEVLKIGKPAVPLLASYLTNDEPSLRNRSAALLAQMGFVPADEVAKAKSVAILMACLTNADLGDSGVVVGAIDFDYLSTFGQNPARDRTMRRRSAIGDTAAGLAVLGEQQAVRPLIAFLDDADPCIREYAAKALGKLGDARAVRPLVACLKAAYSEARKHPLRTESFETANGNIDAGAFLRARSEDPWVTGWETVRDAVTNALTQLGKPVVDALVECLSDGEWSVRKDAGLALQRLGFTAPSPDDEARYFVATGQWDRLRRLGSAAPAALNDCFSCDEVAVRRRAIETLEAIGSEEAVTVLKSAMPDWEINEDLGAALDRMGWRPRTEQERVYLWICKHERAALERAWPMTEKILLDDVRSRQAKRLENAVLTFICMGKEKMIAELVRILSDSGYKEMAETYLNCGHSHLAAAAREWAKNHGYNIISRQGSHKASWNAW